MSQNNLVRRNEIPTNYKLHRENRGLTHQNSSLNEKPKSNVNLFTMRLSNFEKTVLVVSSIVVFALVIFQLNIKNNLSNEKQNLQSLTTRVSHVKSVNNNLQQEISELQNSNRLNKIAHKNNLTLRNNNVRNVDQWVQK